MSDDDLSERVYESGYSDGESSACADWTFALIEFGGLDQPDDADCYHQPMAAADAMATLVWLLAEARWIARKWWPDPDGYPPDGARFQDLPAWLTEPEDTP